MDATLEFKNAAENGDIIIDSHEKMAHIAYIYWHLAREEAERVFDVVEELYKRDWSFGQGNLKFNK